MRLLIATSNPGKLREFERLLADLPVTLVTPTQAGVAGMPVVEDGETFADNARIKAQAYGLAARLPALADDSGLCVDALQGAPGIYSARYAGEQASDAENNQQLLTALAQVPEGKRTARYRAVLWFHDCSGRYPELQAEGVCEGRIVLQPRGEGGFGYDPLFQPDGFSQTMAELSPGVKSTIDHRGRATQQMVHLLEHALR